MTQREYEEIIMIIGLTEETGDWDTLYALTKTDYLGLSIIYLDRLIRIQKLI